MWSLRCTLISCNMFCKSLCSDTVLLSWDKSTVGKEGTLVDYRAVPVICGHKPKGDSKPELRLFFFFFFSFLLPATLYSNCLTFVKKTAISYCTRKKLSKLLSPQASCNSRFRDRSSLGGIPVVTSRHPGMLKQCNEKLPYHPCQYLRHRLISNLGQLRQILQMCGLQTIS